MPLGDWLHEGAAKDHGTGFGTCFIWELSMEGVLDVLDVLDVIFEPSHPWFFQPVDVLNVHAPSRTSRRAPGRPGRRGRHFGPPSLLRGWAMDVLDVLDMLAPSRTSRKGSWTSWTSWTSF